jgi:hypothetical protein
LPETTCRTTGSLPSGDVQVMALFEPANSILAPLPKVTVTVLFDPTMSSLLQAPVRVSVLLLPRMWAPPPAQFKVVVWPEPINDHHGISKTTARVLSCGTQTGIRSATSTMRTSAPAVPLQGCSPAPLRGRIKCCSAAFERLEGVLGAFNTPNTDYFLPQLELFGAFRLSLAIFHKAGSVIFRARRLSQTANSISSHQHIPG